MKRVLEIIMFGLVTYGLLTLCSCEKEPLEKDCECVTIQMFECGVTAFDLKVNPITEVEIDRFTTNCQLTTPEFIKQFNWGKEITTCTTKQ